MWVKSACIPMKVGREWSKAAEVGVECSWFIFSVVDADVGVEWADKHGGLECGCRVVAKCSKVGAKWVLGQYLLYTHDFFYSVGALDIVARGPRD